MTGVKVCCLAEVVMVTMIMIPCHKYSYCIVLYCIGMALYRKIKV